MNLQFGNRLVGISQGNEHLKLKNNEKKINKNYKKL